MRKCFPASAFLERTVDTLVGQTIERFYPLMVLTFFLHLLETEKLIR